MGLEILLINRNGVSLFVLCYVCILHYQSQPHKFRIIIFIEHKHSAYNWEWHCKVKKGVGQRGDFQTDKLWKVARVIIKQNLPGTIRIMHILKLSNMGTEPNSDGAGQKYTREEDMINCVLVGLAAVGSKVPLSIFDNDHVRLYLCQLNPKHRSPHRLERNQIA